MGMGIQYMIGARQSLGELDGTSPDEKVFLVEGSFNEEELKRRAVGSWNPQWRVYQLTEVPIAIEPKEVTFVGNSLTLAPK